MRVSPPETSKSHALRVAVVRVSDKQSNPRPGRSRRRGLPPIHGGDDPEDADLNDPPMGARPDETRTFVVVASSQMDKVDLPNSVGRGAIAKDRRVGEGFRGCGTFLGVGYRLPHRSVHRDFRDGRRGAGGADGPDVRLDYRANPRSPLRIPCSSSTPPT